MRSGPRAAGGQALQPRGFLGLGAGAGLPGLGGDAGRGCRLSPITMVTSQPAAAAVPTLRKASEGLASAASRARAGPSEA